MSPISGQSQPEEVAVSEDIVTELDSLQRSFVGLTGNVKAEVERQLENGVKNNIKLLTRDLQEEQAFPIPSLRSVTTSDELFDAIRPHYNFLNCYLIVNIALHLAGAIAEKATEYKEKVRKFMKTTKIRFLQNTLKRYSRMFRERSNTAIVEIVVENGWEAQNLWLVQNLVTALFPVKHSDELPWYDIVPGSVVMTFIALEHMTPSLIESGRKKTEFMRLVGVISLKIADKLVWKRESEGNKVLFSFENSLIQTTLAENIEAVQFLLQYTQVNVNTKNITNTLISAYDEEVYCGQEDVEIFFKIHHTAFVALLNDVEYELQYVQGQTTANDLSTSNKSGRSTYRPEDNFMNGRVLVGLSNQLPEPLSTRVKQYQATIYEIVKRKSLLIYISSLLEKYFPTLFPNSVEVILTLHNAWRACSVWYVEQLGQLIFTPTLFHKVQWFRVDTSQSLRVVLLADVELMDSLTKECLSDDESVTSLLGVISVQINDTVVTSNDYSNGYTFNEAFKLAEAMENSKVFDLLSQMQQSPVDFVRLREPDNNNNHRFLPEPDSTPLMIACCNNNSQLVRLLLDHNADPNIQSRNSYTALMYSTGNSKIFKMLFDCGARIESCGFFNETVLYYACRVGNEEAVKIIIANNPDLVHLATKNGNTPLRQACRYGHKTIVAMVLQAKADPNIPGNEGWTALKSASRYGHTEIVQLLLQAKADPNIYDNEGWTALKSASRYGHTEIVKMLLQAKANPNVQNNEGWTALQSASRYGHVEIAEKLLKAKADANVQDKEGWTALILASRYGHAEIVGMLLHAKADPNVQNNEGQTALHQASCYGYAETVRILLKCNANPRLSNYKGLTALDLALQHGHNDVGDQLCSVLFDQS